MRFYRSHMLSIAAAALAAAVGAQAALAAVIVSPGSYAVIAGTPVTAQITVSNTSLPSDSDIEGMTLTVQVADGAGAAPKIASIDLLAGTIWSGHVSPAGVLVPSGGDQFQYQSRDLLTDLAGDFVDANGLLATVTFDTTGAAAGTYPITLIGTKTAGRDSALLDGTGNVVAGTFGTGSITISVPEPAGGGVAGTIAAASVVARRRPKARRR